jgi:penicillin-binding protein 1A
MTPGLVVGSWVGADDPRIRFRTTELGQGSSTALPVTAAFFKQINKDPKYKAITDAKFGGVPASLQTRLQCDLYELNDGLVYNIQKSIFQRDSLIHADTTLKPPKETFLQTLYKRKLKLAAAQQRRDSIQAAQLLDGDPF